MTTHSASASVNVPEIADTARRVGRTAIQAGAAVVTVAGALVAVYSVVEPVVGPINRANLLGWFVAAVVAISGNAALYSRLMAIPAVNAVLEKFRLGGQSTISSPEDSETRLLNLSSLTAAAPAGD